MLPYPKGQKVFGYIDGSLKQLSKEITDATGNQSLNTLFENWKTQDNLILSCLNASLTDEVLV